MATLYIETDVDIEVNDFLEECSDREIEKIIKFLKMNGYIKKESDFLERETTSDSNWNNEVYKLFDNKWRLTKEQENQILNITKSIL